MDFEEKKDNDITKSLIAEQSVLGSIFMDIEIFSTITEILKVEDFGYESHGLIYKELLDMQNEELPLDMVVLLTRLTNKGLLETVGGIEYITNLSSVPDYSKNAREYANIVKDKSNLRKIINTSNMIVQSAYQGETSKSVLEKAEKGIFDISQENQHSSLVHIKEPLLNVFDQMEENFKDKRKVTGLQTGFKDLDFKTKGLQDSDMIVIAARPGVGKTAFALNLALATASRDNSSVAIFSLEMSAEQLTQRLLSAASAVELSKIKDGNLDTEDFSKIARAINTLGKCEIYIDDTPGITMTQIRSKCRRKKIQGKLDLVVIDFLQLIEPINSNEPRQVQVSNISRAIKILAKEMHCPVLALSQINRDSEKSKDHRPMLSDLRESGAIEQDADIVMFLYRDDMYNPDTDKPGITEVILAKHRNGETGTVELSWLGKYQKFLGLEKNY